MKTKLFFFLIIFFSLTGCSEEKEQKNGEETFLEKLELAPVVKDRTLPEWLIAKIEEIHDPNFGYIKVYEGLFEGQEIYYIYDLSDSCFLCEIYYKDGKQLMLGLFDQAHFDNFCKSSKDWKVILELGDIKPKMSE